MQGCRWFLCCAESDTLGWGPQPHQRGDGGGVARLLALGLPLGLVDPFLGEGKIGMVGWGWGWGDGWGVL